MSDRALAAQWSLLLTELPGPGESLAVYNEYLKQLLVSCSLGALLGLFSRPPVTPLKPLPAYHSVWRTGTKLTPTSKRHIGVASKTAF